MPTRGSGHRREGERGQVLVLVAGGFIAFIAIAGLVLDGGIAFLNRRDGQNAADLAAVAGTQIVAKHYIGSDTEPRGTRTSADVFSVVASTAAANQCQTDGAIPCNWSATFVGAGLAPLGPVNESGPIPAGTIGVQVNVNRAPGTFLSQLLGLSRWSIDTVAVATATSPSGVPQGAMLPIAACGWSSSSAPNDCAQASNSPNPGNFVDFVPFQVYDLTDGKDAPGGFGWLSWTGSNSASIMADRICNPQNPAFSIDSPYDDPGTPGYLGTNPANGETWFPIDPGKSNHNLVRACLDEWIESGATVLIPIYDLVVGNGNNAWYHITGVAAFVLTSREQPAVDNIQGYFVKYFPLGDVPSNAQLPPNPADGLVNLSLVR